MQQEYQLRRNALINKLPSHSVVIMAAAHEVLRNGDAHHRFRQDSDFYYLTGFNEPEAVLVLLKDGAQSILFTQSHDKTQEIWTGKRLGVEDAPSVLGISQAFDITQLNRILPQLLEGQHHVYYPIEHHGLWEKSILPAYQVIKTKIRRGMHAPDTFCDVTPLLADMRLFKSPSEVACMRRAADATVQGHLRAMRHSQQAQYEYQLEAELIYAFVQQGCRNVAYDSIVAGGARACTLHYTQNNQVLKSDELVLIDAGAEYNNYAADVTRTFPLSGHFNPAQRQIYDLVLQAQHQAMQCIKPGALFDDMQQAIIQVLTQGLVDLGLLQGSIDELIANAAYKAFYMHNSGHWLGLDVHDAGAYRIQGQSRELQPGMVLTIEPGLYIPLDANVEDRFKGIGVRIEDDILITNSGFDNLTGALPSHPDDIKAIICG